MIEYVFVFGIMFLAIGLISWSWVKGIDYMKENHPDYKGDDFLNWGNEKIDDEFSRQARANQPEIIEKKSNPKQFNGIESGEPFVKTRIKKNQTK
jgi:hypothetical protein